MGAWFRDGGAPSTVRLSQVLKLVEFNMTKFVRFLIDDSGATAIEYGLIAAAMGMALIAAMPAITVAITGKFSSLGAHITSGK